MTITIDKYKAIVFILETLYKSEWEVIDGLQQHPDGYNFEEWLEHNNLVHEE